MKHKSGEQETEVYITSFGLRIMTTPSEYRFYALLYHLREAGLIDEFGYRTYEYTLFSQGFDLVA